MNAREAATIHTKDGGKIRMHFDQNFTRLVLWAVAGKGFLCVEPINSSPNGLVTGDCLYLEPNGCKEAVISFEVL
jgi:galactose mutarotase-like enzyme